MLKDPGSIPGQGQVPGLQAVPVTVPLSALCSAWCLAGPAGGVPVDLDDA